MKHITRNILAILLAFAMLFCAAASLAETPSRGDLLHFIPTVMTVSSDEVKVEGYFVNLNSCDVKNFTDFDLTVYDAGKKLLSGEFGDINRFTVPAKGTRYQSFTFTGRNGLSLGTHVCGDSFHTTFSCNFTYLH